MNRTRPPAIAAPADYRFPAPLRRTLGNGMRLVLIERPAANFAEFRMVFEGGFAADPGERSGLCGLAMEVLTQGRLDGGRGRADRFVERLGATLRARATVDAGVIEMSAFAAKLDASIKAFADAVLCPRFEAKDLEAVRSIRRATIAREKTSPFALALRLVPALVYPKGDPYAKPFTGSGTESGLENISLDDLRAFYRENLVPARATLVAAGPAIDALAVSVEKAFAAWRAERVDSPREPEVAARAESDSARAAIADFPGAAQSAVFAAFATVPRASASAEALIAADAILARMFTSRLNMNLREAKGWTYGVRSFLGDARRRGLWIVYAFVEREMTGAAMREIERELHAISDGHPPSREELSRAASYLSSTVPMACETTAQVASLVADGVACGLAEDYYCGFVERIGRIGVKDLANVVRDISRLKPITWLVACDAASVSAHLESSGFALRAFEAD